MTEYDGSEYDCGLMWNDPALGIDRPVTPDQVMMSDMDTSRPMFADLPGAFYLFRSY